MSETPRRRPVWMEPAWQIGRLRPQFRAAASADASALERFPRAVVESVPLLLVLLLAVGFAAIHGMHNYQNSRAGVDWTKLALADTYLEIPIFLFLAILVGEAVPSLGVTFVLLYTLFDIAVSATQPQELTPLPAALAGRLVSYWALWLLAVEIPVFSRSLAGSVREMPGGRFVLPVLTGLTAGALTWVWTQGAPILARPMFVWSSLGSVPVGPIRPVQDAGAVFAVFAGAIAGAMALWRGRDAVIEVPGAGESNPTTARAAAVVQGLVVAALLTITLSGLVASTFEGAVLFVALASSGPFARFVANRTIIGTAVRVTPLPLRYALASALSFGVSWLVVGQLFQANIRATIGNANDEFFSVVFAMAISFFLVALATTPGTRGASGEAGIASIVSTVMVVGGGALTLVLATSMTALADNCSSLTDCWGTPFLAALGGGAMPLLFAILSKPPPKPYNPTMDGLLVPPPAQKPDKYAFPGGDHMPPDGHSIASAPQNDGTRG